MPGAAPVLTPTALDGRVEAFEAWAASALHDPKVYNRLRRDCDTPHKICAATYYRADDPALFYSVDYAKSVPDAAIFFCGFRQLKLDCAAFGKHRVVRQWPYASGVKIYCAMEEGLLKGANVLVEQWPDEVGVRVFTDAFVGVDPDFADVLYKQTSGIRR